MKRINILHTCYGIMVLLLTILSHNVKAQRYFSQRTERYLGTGISFGVRSMTVSGPYNQIDNLRLIQEGATIHLIKGTSLWRVNMGGGYYYSSQETGRTINQIEFSTAVELHPLNLGGRVSTSRFSPYATAGLHYNHYMFYGFYANGPDSQYRNLSVSAEPYIGACNSINVSGGIGVKYQIPFYGQFLHIVGAMHMSQPIESSTTEKLRGTSISPAKGFSVGILFGSRTH